LHCSASSSRGFFFAPMLFLSIISIIHLLTFTQACADFPQGEQCGSLLNVLGCRWLCQPPVWLEPLCSV
jgi:hypothetical protein